MNQTLQSNSAVEHSEDVGYIIFLYVFISLIFAISFKSVIYCCNSCIIDNRILPLYYSKNKNRISEKTYILKS